MQFFQHIGNYSLAYWRMCFGSLLFFASFNLVIPELPEYLLQIGGSAHQKGYIIAIFTLVAMLSRPFSGRLSDTIGRVPVMLFGIWVCVFIGFLYPIMSFVLGFFVLRFFHGLSTGFTPTGNAAYIADIVPDHKRGEAMGYLGFFNSLGMAAGPALGSQLMLSLNGEYKWLFWASSFLSLLALLVIFGLPETLQTKQKISWRLLKISWEDVYEPRVIWPAGILVLTAFSFGAVLTVIPDLATHIGMNNKGTFFTVFTLSSLASRLTAGRVSDKVGRVPVLFSSTLLLAVSLVVIGMATSRWTLLGGAALYGFGLGINSPTIYAWGIDLSAVNHKGRGMGTIYIALEIGIGLGALLAGYLFGDRYERVGYPFFISAVLCVIAFFLLLRHPSQRRRKKPV